MIDVLFWLYLVNAVLTINHEIDSAYWKEWELFHLPGAIGGFLRIHLPLLGVILYGLAALAQRLPAGLWFSLLLSAGGLFAFGIHTHFLGKGREEFDPPVSRAILGATGVVSLCQLGLTVYLITGGAFR
jgi:hypothetical protein